MNNFNAAFACFCMEEDFYKKYDYFSTGILNENPKAFSTLGYLIDNKILDDIKI